MQQLLCSPPRNAAYKTPDADAGCCVAKHYKVQPPPVMTMHLWMQLLHPRAQGHNGEVHGSKATQGCGERSSPSRILQGSPCRIEVPLRAQTSRWAGQALRSPASRGTGSSSASWGSDAPRSASSCCVGGRTGATATLSRAPRAAACPRGAAGRGCARRPPAPSAWSTSRSP